MCAKSASTSAIQRRPISTMRAVLSSELLAKRRPSGSSARQRTVRVWWLT